MKWFKDKSPIMIRRPSTMIVLLIVLIVIIIFYSWEWDGWEKLSYIGNMLAGIGIIFIALQYITQKNSFEKDKFLLIGQLNTGLTEFRDLWQRPLKDNDTSEYTKRYLTQARDCIQLLSRMNVLCEKSIIHPHELYLFGDQSLTKLIIVVINTMLEYQSSVAAVEVGFDSMIKEQKHIQIISLWEKMSQYDSNLKVVEGEIEKLKEINLDKMDFSLMLGGGTNSNNK
ncbi:hypothetical protein [Halalkalibacter alkaliphilus]|uniref:Uncharacterized protein n=1 Tax=Halalkalibacter alkaliphilus TaxID=2917993 RepID=A0A9X2I3P0_9BACI|nr:hypothetical protein [Halalkalibacter alkaliphilus]MCL7747038.1 hypothetical protein [Halalkalibacter alkaliphilus]